MGKWVERNEKRIIVCDYGEKRAGYAEEFLRDDHPELVAFQRQVVAGALKDERMQHYLQILLNKIDADPTILERIK
jgi:acetone carboxylase gamma subunit